MNSSIDNPNDPVSESNLHNTSDWMSDDDESSNDRCLKIPAHELAASGARNLVSRRVYGWTLVLVVVTILGNLSVPVLLDRLIGDPFDPFTSPPIFPEASMIEWVVSYFLTTLRAVFFGGWFAEYVALWLWVNSYVTSRTTRWLLGLFLSAAISYTVVLGMSIAWGPAPTDFFWFSMIGGLGLYATINLLLKLFLRRSDLRWQPIQLGTGNRYSIRALLGAMAGSAILMLGLKLFPYSSEKIASKSILSLAPPAIWLAWLAIAIAILIWLQLGSIFSLRRGRFVVCFLALASLGPIIFHLIGAWVLAWDPRMVFTPDFEQFLIVYSMEVGLIVGVAMMLPLLPRNASSHEEQS